MALKKEFITTWSKEPVNVNLNRMINNQPQFFDKTRDSDKKLYTVAILPDDIPFDHLQSFVGLRTKVTIEVLPW